MCASDDAFPYDPSLTWGGPDTIVGYVRLGIFGAVYVSGYWRSLGCPVGLQGSQGNPGFGNPPPVYVTWSGHIIQGHIVQVRHFPRDGRSKGWNVSELSFGGHNDRGQIVMASLVLTTGD